jgi:gliding motility-associated protein GldL
MFLSSERGKRVLNFLYSWGAAIVIIGALFKLLHFPHANQILFVAMILEACVFIISGFERPANDYSWEEVFPVLKSRNPLDRPEFAAGGNASEMIVAGDGEGTVMTGGTANIGGGTVVIGGFSGMGAGMGTGESGEGIGGGGGDGRPVVIGGGGFPSVQPTPQELVNNGMAAMGLNIPEADAEVLAESIKKLNSAAEQISKMADLTEVTQNYIEQISTVSQNLEKFSEITGSLGEVSDTLIQSCKVISGSAEEGTEEQPASYVEHMSRLNENVSGLNQFYETQLSELRSQMENIQHINAGLNRIRSIYDSSIVDSTAFRNENERMAQLLSQLNQVYGRLLQAMTINIPAGAYPPPPPPPGQPGYQQPAPPYPGGYASQGGGYR